MLFTIKKIVTPFLLPPGIFILLLVVIGLASMARRHWRVGFLNLFMGFALYALSISPVATGLIRGLEAGFSFPANPTGDVIILLGGGAIRKVADLTGTAAPTPLMMGRIVTAVRLYRQTSLPIIITGGRLSDDDISEAQVAKRFLMDLGVPENAIIEEGMARDTAENARFTAAICRRKGFSRPIVLTTAFHLKRALIAFNDAGMRVTPFPASFFGASNASSAWYGLLPGAATLYLSANALHEYLGIWYYRIME
jgi:uncharacterized SAM-binding protein YcdF (DUF218 family)